MWMSNVRWIEAKQEHAIIGGKAWLTEKKRQWRINTLRNSTEYEPTGLQAMNVTKITSNQIWNESWQFHFLFMFKSSWTGRVCLKDCTDAQVVFGSLQNHCQQNVSQSLAGFACWILTTTCILLLTQRIMENGRERKSQFSWWRCWRNTGRRWQRSTVPVYIFDCITVWQDRALLVWYSSL